MSVPHRLIQVNDRWYAAFRCKNYGDFVIEFSQSFATKNEAIEATKTGQVSPIFTHDEK